MRKKIFFCALILFFWNFAYSETSIYIIGSGNMGAFLAAAFSEKNQVKVISQTGSKNKEISIPTETQAIAHISKKTYKLPIVEWNEIDHFLPNSTIFITVKAPELKNLGSLLKNRLNGTQNVVFLQNGLNVMESVPELTDYHKKIRAMVHFGVNITDTNPPLLKVGAPPRVSLSSHADDDIFSPLSELLKESNIGVLPYEKSVLKSEWTKSIHNIFMNGLTAVCNKTIGEILKNETTLAHAKKLIEEARIAAKLDGVEFTDQEIENVFMLAEKMSAHSTSMREDFNNNRKTESQWLYGHILKISKQNGLATPVSKTIHDYLESDPGIRLSPSVQYFCGEKRKEAEVLEQFQNINKAMKILNDNQLSNFCGNV